MTKANQLISSGYALVNGLNLYYEVHGDDHPRSQTPLVLLHGGLGSTEMFGENLPLLAQDCQVIGVHLQAHGRTADIDRPLSFEQMADDVAALIHHLGLTKVDVMGFSLGGGVALQTAIRHPELVRKLVLVSTPFKRSGWYPEMQAGMSQMGAETAVWMQQTPVYEAYARQAPRLEDFPVLLTKVGQLLRQDYDWSEQAAALKMPVLIVGGDGDGLPPRHMVEFFELLGGGQRDGGYDGSGMSSARLAILPGLTHYNINTSPALAQAVIPFLDLPYPAGE